MEHVSKFLKGKKFTVKGKEKALHEMKESGKKVCYQEHKRGKMGGVTGKHFHD